MKTLEAQRVLVVGAGIGGLATALALRDTGAKVTLLERDPSPEQAGDWQRPGVAHAVHPHFFMGRLRNLMRDRHPGLLEALVEAGARERDFADHLAPTARGRLRPAPIDEQLTAIAVRRTTFERTVRAYVEREKLATIISSADVQEPLCDAGGPPIRVRGLRTRVEGVDQELTADIVVDASGRRGQLHQALEERGARFEVEHRRCGILYLTRWYRLLEGQAFPSNAGVGALQYDDLIAGVLPADDGRFTVTFQLQADDHELLRALKHPDTFHRVSERIGAIAPWIEQERAEPLGGVHGYAHMDAFWRHVQVDRRAQAHGLFFVGDSAVRTNPKFGRGCTWSFLSAHLLADALTGRPDPEERVRAYEEALEAEFRSDWRATIDVDRMTRQRYEIARGQRSASLGDRFARWFEKNINDAGLVDAHLFRHVWAGFHGLRPIGGWARHPEVWMRLARYRFEAGRHRDWIDEVRKRPSREEIVRLRKEAA